MALTGTDRGTGTHNSSATSFTLSPSGNFAAGSMGVLCVSADNSAASGVGQTITITDTIGNTWTRQINALNNPGQNLGVEGGIFTTPQNIGPLQTGTTITVTFANATTAKTWTLMEVVAAAGARPVVITASSGTGTSGTGTTSPTTGAIAAQNFPPGRMLIAALFLEAGTSETITQDGDSSSGTWSTQQTAEVGATTSGSNIASQRKIITARATQTYNPTLSIAGDLCLGWIVIHEALTTGYEAVIRADTPIAYWRLNEPSGLFIYDAMGVAEMDVLNTPTMGISGLLTGDANTAISWLRSSTENASGGSTIPAGTAAGASLEGWMKFDTLTAATRYPIMRWFPTGQDHRIYYDVDATALRYTYIDDTAATRTINSDAWVPTVGPTYHIVVAHNYTAETVTFYVNGVLLSIEDVSAFTVPVTPILGFGGIARAGSDYMDGTLDEVAIYSYVLSATQVANHYAAGISQNPPITTPRYYHQVLAH